MPNPDGTPTSSEIYHQQWLDNMGRPSTETGGSTGIPFQPPVMVSPGSPDVGLFPNEGVGEGWTPGWGPEAPQDPTGETPFGDYQYGGYSRVNAYQGTPYNPSNSPAPTANTRRPGGTAEGWGGVSGVNPQASGMDYNQINEFSDAAYENAKRWMDPQLQQERERFQQELVNKGIDPYSEAGRKALEQMQRGQNDMQSEQQFNAMKFGTDIQNQMFDQANQRAQLANMLMQKDWDLTESGRQFNDTLRQRAQEFDVNAAMEKDMMEFGKMMGLEGLDYRDYMTGVDERRYQDEQAWKFANAAPGADAGQAGGTTDPMLSAILSQYGEDSDFYKWALQSQQGG